MRADGKEAAEFDGARGGPSESFRLRAQLRSAPWAVWALVGLQLAVLLAYSVLMPVYRAPDEPQNFDMATAARMFPSFTGEHRAISPAVVRSYAFAEFNMDTRRMPVSPSPPAARDARPSFAALSWPPATSMTRNQQWQHPPLYPAALGAALTVVEALYPPAHDWAFDQTVGFARLVSVGLVAPLPLFAFLAARRLRVGRRGALVAAVVPLAIPQLAHIGSAVSHDNLLVALVGLATVVVAFVLRGDACMRTALGLGTLAGLALLTKGFALFLPAWVAGVYVLAAVRWRHLRFLVAGGVAVVVAVGLGGWWWARNVAVHGAVQPTGIRLPRPDPGFVPDVGWWLSFVGEALPLRFWGSLGWYQASLPGWLTVAATGVLVAGVAASLAWRRAGGPARADLLAVAFPAVAIAGIVAYGGWEYYAATGYALGVQGRYLYPGLAGLAVLVGAGVAVLPPWLSRWGPLGLLAGAVGMHAVAVATVLRDVYQAGAGVGWAGALAAVSAWSPWGPLVQALGVAGLAAALAAAATALVGEAGRQPADDVLDANATTATAATDAADARRDGTDADRPCALDGQEPPTAPRERAGARS